MKAARWAGNVLLTMITLLFLASIGGGMLFVWWALVPLHWWAARGAGPVAAGWWACLAAASMAEVGMLLTYVATGNELAVAVAGGLGFVGTAAVFVIARRRRARQPASCS
jgi:hypothetical protein